MSPDQIAALVIVGVNALLRILQAIQPEELTEDRKAEIRSLHAAVLAETQRLTPVPEPPGAA